MHICLTHYLLIYQLVLLKIFGLENLDPIWKGHKLSYFILPWWTCDFLSPVHFQWSWTSMTALTMFYWNHQLTSYKPGFPSGSVGKDSACNAGDLGLIPGSERSPEEGNGDPLQYSYLDNSMDRGAKRATVHRIVKSWTWQVTKTHNSLKWELLEGRPISFGFFHLDLQYLAHSIA